MSPVLKPFDALIQSLELVRVEDLLKRSTGDYFARCPGGYAAMGKRVASFGTHDGGLLIVGQDYLENGGKILGINEEQFEKDWQRVRQEVKPAPFTKIRTVTHQGKILKLIEVRDAGSLRPCYFEDGYYDLRDTSIYKMDPAEVRQCYLRYYGAVNAENKPTNASIKDVDEKELEHYAKQTGKTKKEVMDRLSSNSGTLKIAGAILLGKDPAALVDGAYVEIQRYSNPLGAMPVPLGSPVKISKPARQMITQAAAHVERHLPTITVGEGTKAREESVIPADVIREAIATAVAHRSYASLDRLLIRLFDDGFDITNPALINEKTWDELKAIHGNYRPNELIYAYLKPEFTEAERDEGLWKLSDVMRKRGRATPEFKIIGNSPSLFYLRFSLAPAKANEAKVERLDKIVQDSRELTTTHVMAALRVSRVTAIKLLEKFVKNGALKRVGKARNAKYVRA